MRWLVMPRTHAIGAHIKRAARCRLEFVNSFIYDSTIYLSFDFLARLLIDLSRNAIKFRILLFRDFYLFTIPNESRVNGSTHHSFILENETKWKRRPNKYYAIASCTTLRNMRYNKASRIMLVYVSRSSIIIISRQKYNAPKPLGLGKCFFVVVVNPTQEHNDSFDPFY